ncbi:MAG: hypothetical protein JKY70_21995 [Mucilaginibacter sp.]|nr:hypothetical protein [Mucilaginibacter sp.]
MKKLLHLVLLCALISFGACKKTEQPLLNNNDPSAALSTSSGLPPLSVITIAGMKSTQGFADGKGKEARFDFPHGIDIAENGDLYVADLFNNAIRKITPDGTVSTVKFPTAIDGQKLTFPERVLFSKDGTMNVLSNYAITPDSVHKLWILKPSGELITPKSQVNYYTYRYYNIAIDPFSNYLQLCGYRYVTGHETQQQGFIESGEIVNGIMGQHPYTPPRDSLNTESLESPAVSGIYCGNNGVKYIVIRRRFIYKLTKSGVFTRIFRNIELKGINDLVATKDSRTLYLTVNGGDIISISNNKLTKLVGVDGDFFDPDPDGVGKEAFVVANFIALSKDESTLYFTDGNETVRKLILR